MVQLLIWYGCYIAAISLAYWLGVAAGRNDLRVSDVKRFLCRATDEELNEITEYVNSED